MIHISDVLTFKSCRRKWDFSSPLRRNLTPIGIYIPFFVGRVIHGALDHYYRFGTLPSESVDTLVAEETREIRANPALWEARKQEIARQAVLCKGILVHYVQWNQIYNGLMHDRELDFLGIEQRFDVPLRTNRGFIARNMRLAGRFDGVVRHRQTDQLYLWEIKTTRSIAQRVKQLDLEEQADAYALAAQEVLGEPITGIIYILIRKDVPESPVVLKNGFLSQNKNLDTTFAHYLAAIRQHHGHMATREFISQHYGPFLQHLLDNSNSKPFFARIVVQRSEAQLKTARAELYAVAREMTKPNIPIYHHGQPGCNWCLFREPCLAIQHGAPEAATKLLEHYYTKNTYHQTRESDEL